MKSELIQIKKKIDTDIDKMTQHIFLRYHIIILSFYTSECKFTTILVQLTLERFGSISSCK